MSPLDIFNHLINLVAPALVLGLLVAAAARFLMKKPPQVPVFWAQVAMNSIAGGAALAAGLWLFGVDGKMASYAALVLVVASAQWLMLRGWKG